MNWKEEMIKRITKDIKDIMKYRGLSKDEAIAIVKEESCAGPAVWDEVLKLGEFEKRKGEQK